MAEDGAFSSELAAPQAIGDHHGIGESWRGVAGVEQAAELRARPENTEIIGTDHPTLQSLGMLTTGQVGRPLIYSRDRRENAGAIPQVVELRNGKADALCAQPPQIGVQYDQLLRIMKREGPEKGRVHDTEDRGIGADPQRQGEQHRRGDARRLPHGSQREADVLP